MKLLDKLALKYVKKHNLDIEKENPNIDLNDYYVIRYGNWASTYGDGYQFTTYDFRIAKLLSPKEMKAYRKTLPYASREQDATSYFKLIKGNLILPYISDDWFAVDVRFTVNSFYPLMEYIDKDRIKERGNTIYSLNQLQDIDDQISKRLMNEYLQVKQKNKTDKSNNQTN